MYDLKESALIKSSIKKKLQNKFKKTETSQLFDRGQDVLLHLGNKFALSVNVCKTDILIYFHSV